MSDDTPDNICGDNSCVFGPPTGLGTNGGCRCVGDMRPSKTRIGVIRNIQKLKSASNAKDAEIARLKSELTRIRAHYGHCTECGRKSSVSYKNDLCGVCDNTRTEGESE